MGCSYRFPCNCELYCDDDYLWRARCNAEISAACFTHGRVGSVDSFVYQMGLDKYRMQLIEHNLYVQQQNDTQATVKLSNIVKNEETFELFALYLVKEFSIENLIFLYESTRFKEKCVADGFVKEGEMGKVVQFPNKIKSMQANEKVNYEYIVKRFIDEDAPDCINIAFGTRKTMIGLMQNDATIVEYINSIDKAMEEIVCLLAFDSCARFMTTQSFHNLYK
eukprot:592263_1